MDTYLLANYPYNKSAWGWHVLVRASTEHKRNVYINHQELKGIHGSIIFRHEMHCVRTGRIRTEWSLCLTFIRFFQIVHVFMYLFKCE